MEALVPQIMLDGVEEAARRARFPAGASIEFADLELDSRVGALDRLRTQEPISWVPALGGGSSPRTAWRASCSAVVTSSRSGPSPTWCARPWA